MRILFMGTPSFALPAFHSLIDEGHQVCCVFTQEPKKSGRGYKKKFSPVHLAALNKKIMIKTPSTLKSEKSINSIIALNPDICVVVAYGLILPKKILKLPKYGCINIHASLLPRWRGASPIQSAILSGDDISGVSIMEMSEGIDDGDILAQKILKLDNNITGGVLHDNISLLGANLLIDTLNSIAKETVNRISQKNLEYSYAKKLNKEDACIDWMDTAENIDRQVRAFSPYPGAWTKIKNKRVKILEGKIIEKNGLSKTIINEDLTIACGSFSYKVTKLQLEGKKLMDVNTYLRGNPVSKGLIIG